MENINFKHSIIFFNFCILISPLYLILNFEPVVFCLFLILILGISHGALDNIKGKKLLKLFGYKQTVFFYLTYVLISSLIIIFWLIFPNIVLFLFLIVAAYHFGKEDTIFSFKRRFLISECLFFLKGSSVIVTPLLLQRNATNEIFQILNFNVFESAVFNDQFLIMLLCLSFLSSLFISNKKDTDIKGIMIMDFASLIILNFFLTPILAFTIYFCFLHSIRHSISLMLEMKISSKIFLKKALPLTFITAVIFIGSGWAITLNNYSLDSAILKVIFIGLASLTFPHILLEYLLEKNEK